MLIFKALKTFQFIFLLNLPFFSLSMNLKKQFEDKFFQNSKESADSIQINNTFNKKIIMSNNNDNSKFKFVIDKHHIKEDHIDLETLFNDYSNFENFHKNFEKLKIPNYNNSTSDNKTDNNLINIIYPQKTDKEKNKEFLSKENYFDEVIIRNKTFKEENKKQNQSKFYSKSFNDQNIDTNLKYNLVYYPKASGTKLNPNNKSDGVFGCRDCYKNEETKNSFDTKFPDEEKWVKLEPVKFVKEISAASKADLEIENIEE